MSFPHLETVQASNLLHVAHIVASSLCQSMSQQRLRMNIVIFKVLHCLVLHMHVWTKLYIVNVHVAIIV